MRWDDAGMEESRRQKAEGRREGLVSVLCASVLGRDAWPQKGPCAKRDTRQLKYFAMKSETLYRVEKEAIILRGADVPGRCEAPRRYSREHEEIHISC
jgi:hypothetical protein